MGALGGKSSDLVERIIDYMAPEDVEPEDKGALGKGKAKPKRSHKESADLATRLAMNPALSMALMIGQPGFSKGVTDPLPDNAVPDFAKGAQGALAAKPGDWRDRVASRIEAEPREGEAFAQMLTAPFSGALRDPVRTASEMSGYAPLTRAADAFSETQGAPDAAYAFGRMVRGTGEGALGAATVAGNVYGVGQAAKGAGGALARAYRGGPVAELPAVDTVGALRGRVAKAETAGPEQLQSMVEDAGARAAAAEAKRKPVDWSDVEPSKDPVEYFASAADGVEGAPWRGSAQDISRLVKMQDAGDFAVAEVPFAELNATQTEIRPAFSSVARRYGEGVDDLPVAVRYGGKTYVVDGHHRLATKASEGAPAAQVRLFDMDKGGAQAAPKDWTVNIEGRTAPRGALARATKRQRAEPDAYTPLELTPEEQAAVDLSRANQGRTGMFDGPTLAPGPRRAIDGISPDQKTAMNAEIERLANEAEAAGKAGNSGAVAKAHEDIASIMARTGKPLETTPRIQAIEGRMAAIKKELLTEAGAWKEEELLAEADALMNERRALRGKAPRPMADPNVLGAGGGNLFDDGGPSVAESIGEFVRNLGKKSSAANDQSVGFRLGKSEPWEAGPPKSIKRVMVPPELPSNDPRPSLIPTPEEIDSWAPDLRGYKNAFDAQRRRGALEVVDGDLPPMPQLGEQIGRGRSKDVFANLEDPDTVTVRMKRNAPQEAFLDFARDAHASGSPLAQNLPNPSALDVAGDAVTFQTGKLVPNTSRLRIGRDENGFYLTGLPDDHPQRQALIDAVTELDAHLKRTLPDSDHYFDLGPQNFMLADDGRIIINDPVEGGGAFGRGVESGPTSRGPTILGSNGGNAFEGLGGAPKRRTTPRPTDPAEVQARLNGERGSETFHDDRLNLIENKVVEMSRNKFTDAEIADELDLADQSVQAYRSKARNLGIDVPNNRALSAKDEVLRLALKGIDYRVIAERLSKSPNNVKQQIFQLRRSGVLPAKVESAGAFDSIEDFAAENFASNNVSRAPNAKQEYQALNKLRELSADGALSNPEIKARFRAWQKQQDLPPTNDRVLSNLLSQARAPGKRGKAADIAKGTLSAGLVAGTTYLPARLAADFASDAQEEGTLPAWMIEDAPPPRRGALGK